MKKYFVILIIIVAVFMTCVGMIINSLMSINKLEQLAKEEEVALYYVTPETMCEMQATYNFAARPAGLYFSDSKMIYIASDCYFDYWVLAHELGHHFSIKAWGDHSEKMANLYGARILRSI